MSTRTLAWRLQIGLLLLGAIATIATLVVTNQVTGARLDQFRLTQRQIANLQEQLLSTNYLLKLVQDAESGQRGYLVTEEQVYLAPFNSADMLTPEVIAQILRQQEDNARGEGIAKRIESLTRDRLGELQRTIDLAQSSGFAEARAAVARDEGKRYMDDFRLAIGDLQNDCRKMLSKREQEAADAYTALQSAQSTGPIIAGSIVGFLGLLAIGIFLQESSARAGTEQAAQVRLDQLQSLADVAMRLSTVRAVPTLLGTVTSEARRLVNAQLAVAVAGNLRSGEPSSGATAMSPRYAPYRQWDPAKVPPLTDGRLQASAVVRDPFLITNGNDVSPPLRGLIYVPLTSREGRPLGYLLVSDRNEGQFTQQDETVLLQLAQMTAVAVENANLYSQLQEADQRKDHFLALLGHELRNPLAGILGGAEVLHDQRANAAPNQEMTQLILRQAEHMRQLVDDLLDVSRIARGKLNLRRARLDVGALVDAAVKDYIGGRSRERDRIEVALPDGPVWVDGDPTRLAQCVTNLVHNACKFSESPSTVHVSLTADHVANQAILSVSDRGMGIAPSQLEAMFDAFTQAEGAADRGGLGLGLALVRGLVQLHGGHVSAHSDGLGSGAKFVIVLPLVAAPQETQRPADSKPLQSRRVLLIDDRRDAVLPIKFLLEKAGHQVLLANDGDSGLARAAEFLPDVVLCDIGLPGNTDGYAVARAIRADERLQHAYLVAVTGFGQDGDRQQAVRAGFDYHLAKPVAADDLYQVIEQQPRLVSRQ
jgi:signal transduction histidine kinase/CHASE3 domain sensor protein/ActR/RegA family two-component response regulator